MSHYGIFLSHLSVLEKIDNWTPYRRAVESTRDIPENIAERVFDDMKLVDISNDLFH